MNVGCDSARFARYGIDALITVDVDAMKSVIGKGYDLLYFGGITGRRTQSERVLLDSCHPSFDIVHGDAYVPRVQLDVIRCVWLDCCKMRVISRESSVAVASQDAESIAGFSNVLGDARTGQCLVVLAVGTFNNINEALCSALNCE